jgi:hypothetical protein
MNYENTPQPAIGQIWQDWDSRQRDTKYPRLLRIIWITCDGLRIRAMVIQTGRLVWIASLRMKPTSNGYKYLGTDAELAVKSTSNPERWF